MDKITLTCIGHEVSKRCVADLTEQANRQHQIYQDAALRKQAEEIIQTLEETNTLKLRVYKGENWGLLVNDTKWAEIKKRLAPYLEAANG